MKIGKINNYDIVIKLDSDLSLPVDYFEKIINKMISDPDIGICGGVCTVNGKVEGLTNLDHVRGAIKAYRKNVLLQLGWCNQWVGIRLMSIMLDI